MTIQHQRHLPTRCDDLKVEELFGLFDGHLARQGYIARGGQILDASIVPVPRNHNTRDENVRAVLRRLIWLINCLRGLADAATVPIGQDQTVRVAA